MPVLPLMRWILIVGCSFALTGSALATDEPFDARIARVLTSTPLIDGHNDLPWEIRSQFGGLVDSVHLQSDLSQAGPDGKPLLMTDIPRLRAGHVGGQFWSVWIPTTVTGFEAVQMTLEQMDVVKRMTAQYPKDLEMAYTAADIRRIHRAHKVASLIGIEGGHQINNSLAVLRQMYDAGARYMTLTHTSNTAWADAATDTPKSHGLTPFGQEIVREMNRLGMLVDLSHVSPDTMEAALAVSEAPVIFSHSSARAIVDHPRNVSDEVLRRVAAHGGVVMVNFFTAYVSEARHRWSAEHAAEEARLNHPPYGGLYLGQPERARAALDQWEAAHPRPITVLAQVADHIEHIRAVAGIDHVGLGSDFDGIDETPVGLEGVDRYPALLAELMRRGWSDSDIAKLAGENVLRVMTEAEQVANRLRLTRPASQMLYSSTTLP